jgi:hypothetical protein
MSDYVLREAKTPLDFKWIVNTWLASYRDSKTSGLLSAEPLDVHCPTCHEAIGYDYQRIMDFTVRRILARPGIKVFVASNPREKPPLDLHGWIAVEDGANVPLRHPPRYELEIVRSDAPLVHYVYVKKPYRGFKIARSLFKAAGVDPQKKLLYTCSTPISAQILKVRPLKLPHAEWMPACVRYAKEADDQEHREAPLQQPRAQSNPL